MGIFICIFSTIVFVRQGYSDPAGKDSVPQQKNIKDIQKNEDQGENAPKRSIEMQEIQIHGEVEKPKAMFVIPHATTDYFSKGKNKDFSKEILAPIDIESIEDMIRYQQSSR